MKTRETIAYITGWLDDYCAKAGSKGFVTGISGGIDSALTSTLCALTGRETLCLTLPIHQGKAEYQRAHEHIRWLKEKFKNVEGAEINLTDTFETLRRSLPEETSEHALAMANTRSRLRMSTLYAMGQPRGLLVAGTGNKVEDFGVGFFTKYGDGGVDLSPIADLNKTQVYQLAQELGIAQSIQQAAPTDGLWEDSRSDEDQIGATYPELEWAMNYVTSRQPDGERIRIEPIVESASLSAREQEVLRIYAKLHNANRHKMIPIPICPIPDSLKNGR